MTTSPERSCLVIADISGYTSYLAGVELDHAQDILADLIGTVVAALRPRFKLAKLEGDAAFVYLPGEAIDGSTLLDTVEGTYFAFRRRLRDIGQASSCECNACQRIPQLDLKLVANHGTVVRQRMAGREELVGSDVIVVHRLLKNSVVESLGTEAYVLLSGACIEAMGADPVSLGMRRHVETVESIGEVVCWIHDLDAAWSREQERTSVVVTEAEALRSLAVTIAGSPALVWDRLTSPASRPSWQSGVVRVDEEAAAGRRGVGTRNHCVHGKGAVVEEVLDWHPPEHFTIRFAGEGLAGVVTYELEPVEGGTVVHLRLGRPKRLVDRAKLELVMPFLARSIRTDLEAMAGLVAADAGGAAPDLETVPRPASQPRPPAPIVGGPIQFVG